MHESVLTDAAGRDAVAITAGLFPTVFATAYAAEMDWRIGRGGVTVEEIRRVAAASGQKEPGDDDVELVQGMWRTAIDDFVSEEAERAFLETGTVSAADWEGMRDRVLVVHEHSIVDELVGDVVDDVRSRLGPQGDTGLGLDLFG